ncbi:MAG: hypothetical protein IID40_04800 [Planctomycetes bacterium]|nr:hypothetical protein [Planctomycetota bacterium]
MAATTDLAISADMMAYRLAVGPSSDRRNRLIGSFSLNLGTPLPGSHVVAA